MEITWVGIGSMVLTALWAGMVLAQKGASAQRGLFIGAHAALYLSFMLLRERYFFLIALGIVLVSCAVCGIDAFRGNRWKQNRLYYIMTGILAALVPTVYFVMKSAVSVLAP